MGTLQWRKRVMGKSVQETVPAKPSQEVVNDFSQYMTAPEADTHKTYTKTEINRMSKDDLKNLAKSEGIEGADNENGGELKKILIEHYGL